MRLPKTLDQQYRHFQKSPSLRIDQEAQLKDMVYLRKWQTLLRIAAEKGAEAARGTVVEGAVAVGGVVGEGGVQGEARRALARVAGGRGRRMWEEGNGGKL